MTEKMTKSLNNIVGSVLITLSVVSQSFGDQIHFKSGKIIHAQVIRQDENTITLSQGSNNEWVMKKDLIEKIAKNSAGYRWIDIGDRYFQRGQLDDAHYAYQQARCYADAVAKADIKIFELNTRRSQEAVSSKTFNEAPARSWASVFGGSNIPGLPGGKQPEDFPASRMADADSSQNNLFKGIDPRILKSVDYHAERTNLDPLLIHSLIKVESNYNVRAVSDKGAVGLMQLMLPTAQSVGVSNLYDYDANICAGSRYLAKMLKEYDVFPAEDATRLALAAYYAGPGRVKELGTRIPPGGEIERYVNKVVNEYNRLLRIAGTPAYDSVALAR